MVETGQHPTDAGHSAGRRWLTAVVLITAAGMMSWVTADYFRSESDQRQPQQNTEVQTGRNIVFLNRSDDEDDAPRFVSLWWGDMPADVLSHTRDFGNGHSNIHPQDYAGPDACRKCHTRNYDRWSEHPHRWMNALATRSTVRGDFSGNSISYLGGRVTFFVENDRHMMRLERETTRTFEVTQTLGSRFFQYYIGRQVDGPPVDAAVSDRDHVLPLGYWLDRQEWIPVVHIWGTERPDGERLDPFDAASYATEFTDYASACSHCHTTFAMSDLLAATRAENIANEVPRNLHWSASGYLAGMLDGPPESYTTDEIVSLLSYRDTLPAPEHAVALGITWGSFSSPAMVDMDS